MSTVTESVELQGASSGILNIFGDLIFNDKINFTFLGEVNFSAALPNAQIQMAGNSFQSIIRFKENTGSFQLNGDIEIDSLLLFEGGNFSSKGFAIKTGYLDIILNNIKTDINFDESNVTIGGSAFYLSYNRAFYLLFSAKHSIYFLAFASDYFNRSWFLAFLILSF